MSDRQWWGAAFDRRVNASWDSYCKESVCSFEHLEAWRARQKEGRLLIEGKSLRIGPGYNHDYHILLDQEEEGFLEALSA